MGAWGEGPFDNDDAADWAAEFEGADRDHGLALIADALRGALVGADDYLESQHGAQAVAAASLVAGLVEGRSAWPAWSSAADPVTTWLAVSDMRVPDELVALARAALARVLAPDSELVELWDEAGPSWRQATEALSASLGAA